MSEPKLHIVAARRNNPSPLVAGSYVMQSGGDYRHTTACDAASDCVFCAESDGAFDLKLVEQGK